MAREGLRQLVIPNPTDLLQRGKCLDVALALRARNGDCIPRFAIALGSEKSLDCAVEVLDG